MSKDRVQIIIRVMPDEKDQIQAMAKDEDKSMNQFIVDRVLPEPAPEKENLEEEDGVSSSEVEEELDNSLIDPLSLFKLMKDQIKTKDKQIESLQVLLDQQQQLNLSDKKENERLRINIEELESEDNFDPEGDSVSDIEDSKEDSVDDSADNQEHKSEKWEKTDSEPDKTEVKVDTGYEEKERSSDWWKFWK